MSPEELGKWKRCVDEHIKDLDAVVDDRKTLKNLIVEHLKSYFEWDEIEFNRDFSVIRLLWKRNIPVIKHEKMREFDMDWIIIPNYESVLIKIYPWGLKEGEE